MGLGGGMAGGLEQGGWGLGRVSKGLGGLGPGEGLGAGVQDPQGMSGQMFAWTDGSLLARSDGRKFPPLF